MAESPRHISGPILTAAAIDDHVLPTVEALMNSAESLLTKAAPSLRGALTQIYAAGIQDGWQQAQDRIATLEAAHGEIAQMPVEDGEAFEAAFHMQRIARRAVEPSDG